MATALAQRYVSTVLRRSGFLRPHVEVAFLGNEYMNDGFWRKTPLSPQSPTTTMSGLLASRGATTVCIGAL